MAGFDSFGGVSVVIAVHGGQQNGGHPHMEVDCPG